jgi:hypothetical protein
MSIGAVQSDGLVIGVDVGGTKMAAGFRGPGRQDYKASLRAHGGERRSR